MTTTLNNIARTIEEIYDLENWIQFDAESALTENEQAAGLMWLVRDCRDFSSMEMERLATLYFFCTEYYLIRRLGDLPGDPDREDRTRFMFEACAAMYAEGQRRGLELKLRMLTPLIDVLDACQKEQDE